MPLPGPPGAPRDATCALGGPPLASFDRPAPYAALPESGYFASAWCVLLAARALARAGAPAGKHGLDAAGRLLPASSPAAWLELHPRSGYEIGPGAPAEARPFLELYLPIAAACAATPTAVAHLGQSLDGNVATASGDSYYVTGPDNVVHLHRMRALADAVIVGAETVARDDPQLTVRHVEGGNPVRVVLDPRRRLPPDRRVFADGAAPTLVVTSDAAADVSAGSAETLAVPSAGGGLDLDALVAALHARGLHALFIEGGGTTVSAFLEAGLLDRLQVAVSPLVTGAGRPGLRLPSRERIAECLRPAHRVFAMGGDVLFDCDLRRRAEPGRESRGAVAVRRVY